MNGMGWRNGEMTEKGNWSDESDISSGSSFWSCWPRVLMAASGFSYIFSAIQPSCVWKMWRAGCRHSHTTILHLPEIQQGVWFSSLSDELLKFLCNTRAAVHHELLTPFSLPCMRNSCLITFAWGWYNNSLNCPWFYIFAIKITWGWHLTAFFFWRGYFCQHFAMCKVSWHLVNMALELQL